MEIERKYLVASLPDVVEQCPHIDIEQAYLSVSPTVRVRRADHEYILTVKQRLAAPSSAIHNREEEFPMSQAAYEHLLAKCDGCVVRKTRYRVPIEGHVAEVDVFHGAHEGLVLAEVEFADTESANRFCPPAWMGQEVSADSRYTNAYLAMHPLHPKS